MLKNGISNGKAHKFVVTFTHEHTPLISEEFTPPSPPAPPDPPVVPAPPLTLTNVDIIIPPPLVIFTAPPAPP